MENMEHTEIEVKKAIKPKRTRESKQTIEISKQRAEKKL